ncbi:MAG: hypothetical protein KF856_08830 [Cyclobacteriaceae bacterium]|nr:hypothetical protein [Cyclobacteriaceae bacterium]
MKTNLNPFLKDNHLTELDSLEQTSIQGGDVDGLMRGEGPTWDNFTTNVGYVAGFVTGLFKSLF